MRQHRPLRVVALLATGALLAASCSSDSGDSADTTIAAAGDEFGRDVVEEGEPVEGGRMVIALPGETDGYHPTANNWAVEGHFVGSAIFEALARFNGDGTVEPYLAENIEHDDDFRTWTITLRDGILFHDESPLDADAVVTNLETATTEGLTSLTFTGTIDSIRAVDPLTVEVVTTEPWATFDRVLAGVPGYMAAPSMLESEEAATNPVGTGPFQFDEWVQDSNFVASKWERYWQTDDEGRQLPYLNEIEYQIIVDDQSRMAALESGDVDLILTTDADDVKAAREMDDVVSVEDNFTEETFVMLNTGQAPFDNPNAREALAYGTDVEALIQTVGADITIAAESPWAEGTPWHVEDPGYVEYDPVRAQQAVDAYVDETGQPLEFDLAGIAQVSVTQVQELLVEQWRQLGIAANIDTLEQTAYISNIATGDFEAAWFRNYSYWDPDNKYVFMHSKFANGVGELSINFTQVSNDELDDLLDRGRQSGDPDERREIYAEVARLWNEQLTNIWLFQTPFALIGRAEVRGLNPTREDGFGNLQPKPWIGGLWLDE